MKSRPLVSFVAAVFNQQNTVVESVNSMLRQSYENIEVIVVDDGSSDSTFEIVSSLQDPRLKVLRKENGGPSSAFNFGISHCTGSFIAFMSGDDICDENRVLEQLEFFEGMDADLLFCVPESIDENDFELESEKMPFIVADDYESANDYFRHFFYKGNFLCAPSCMIKKIVLDAIGPLHEGLLQLQDFEYWIRACKLGYKIQVVKRNLLKYRWNLKDKSNLSSPSNANRINVEHKYIMQSYFDDASPELIYGAFEKETKELAEIGTYASLMVAKAMIYLHSEDDDCRQFGFNTLIDILDLEDARMVLRELYDIEPRDVFQRLNSK